MWQASQVEILENYSEELYHQSSGIGPDKWVTRSILRDWLESPRGCYLRHVAKHPLAQFGGNAGCNMGSLVEAIAENRILEYGFLIKPAGMSFATKEGKAWKADHQPLLDSGITLVKDEEVAQAKFLLECLRAHPICRYCFDTATDRQVVVRWTDEATGLRLQVRIDLVRRERFLADLKTGVKPPGDFVSSADSYGYDLQAALYSRAWQLATGESLPFCFPFVQTTYPFDAAVIQLPDQITDNADVRLRRAIEGISAQQWGEEQSEPLVPTPPFWWTARYESLVGGVA